MRPGLCDRSQVSHTGPRWCRTCCAGPAALLRNVGKCWENVWKRYGTSMENEQMCFWFGDLWWNEIFMEINIWQWLMGKFHGKYHGIFLWDIFMGYFYGIFLWDHPGDDKSPFSSYCIHFKVGCYIMLYPISVIWKYLKIGYPQISLLIVNHLRLKWPFRRYTGIPVYPLYSHLMFPWNPNWAI